MKKWAAKLWSLIQRYNRVAIPVYFLIVFVNASKTLMKTINHAIIIKKNKKKGVIYEKKNKLYDSIPYSLPPNFLRL